MQRDFIAQLEAELEKSLKQLETAKQARELAVIVEAKWEQDVKALKSLLQTRRNDSENDSNVQDYSTAADPLYISGYEELNRVEWVFIQIAKAGPAGMLPTEIYETAQQAGKAMHPNYPYVVTKKLLERGRVEKVGKRYRVKQKEVSSEEKTS